MGKINIGGQAVIEGIMMRSPKYISTVIRRASGELENRTDQFEPITKRVKILGLPVLRGFISLVETMKIGVSTLNWSGDKAIEDEKIAKGESVDKEETIIQKNFRDAWNFSCLGFSPWPFYVYSILHI